MTTDMNTITLFMHIPRTGGTTLRDITERVYKSSNVIEIEHLETSIKQIQNLSRKKVSRTELIKGHFAFGLHKYLDSPIQYFTFFRNPVDRVISTYKYIRSHPHHRDYEYLENKTLEEYLESGRNHMLYNGQTRLLNGIDTVQNTPIGEINTDHLDNAKSNLEKYFIAVGLTERFDESILYLQNIFNWKTPYYSIANKTQKKSKPVLDDSTTKLILEYNEFDMQLYMYANTLLDNQLESTSSIVQAANDFKKKNRLLSKIFITNRLERLINRLIRRK